MKNNKFKIFIVAGALLSFACASQAMELFENEEDKNRLPLPKDYWVKSLNEKKVSKEEYKKMNKKQKEIYDQIAWEHAKRIEMQLLKEY